ncbi:MAG: GNAT family N-acetyltransferase [Pseudomonadota bacterium]
MNIRIHTSISEISEDSWNALVRDNHPFLRHEFLHAMERHGCVGEKFGWLPRHITVHDNDRLIAAMPLYEKHNSYGEFVFDNAWADAYVRAGRDYYPKLVSAIPYTPATGQRMLSLAGRERESWPLLLQTALQLTKESGASSFHMLFPDSTEHEFLRQQGLLSRHDCQFHWRNDNYRDFDDFLNRLRSRKRNNIRKERGKVAQAGIRLRQLDGHSATPLDWRNFASFYEQTFAEKWGMATFNLDFFEEVAQRLPEQVVLVLADAGSSCVAGALMYRSDTTLFGRHWGCSEQVDSLHFEACYYQGIEYCIRHGLQHFEPGAQGEHKIARGFLPTLTKSSHWIAEEEFRQPVGSFVRHERQAVAGYMRQLGAATPYKKSESTAR